jgi:hypothetical protein
MLQPQMTPTLKEKKMEVTVVTKPRPMTSREAHHWKN